MKLENNPFEYEAANNLTDELIAEYFIDDFNYSRFIQSRRNVFLVGERGSGKTMALLFNRWRLQKLLAEREGRKPSLTTIGVYIPCNTPLTHKTEYQLLDDFRATVLSEHFLVLSMTYGFAETLSEIPDVLEGAVEESLRQEASFVLGADLPEQASFFEAVMRFVQRELLNTQRALNRGGGAEFYENTFSFASVFVPLVHLCSRRVPRLADAHFLLMLDDAHTLNKHQVRALNSWIAYRDHSLFSFKVAVAKVDTHSKLTSSGGSILEGHDYTEVDLEASYQNPNSSFYQLAKTLMVRRLEKIGVKAPPEEFFPVNARMEADLRKSAEFVRREAHRKFGETKEKAKAVTDFVYKYTRAHYFKTRPLKANRPPYSGFETLVFLSTGVIRNLLEPCFWMYDRAMSELGGDVDDWGQGRIQAIEPRIQTEVILERSKRVWEWLEKGIANDVQGCSLENGRRAYKLMNALAVLFRRRLAENRSEPCAVSFTISGQEDENVEKLMQVIEVLRRGQLLYLRSGPAKDKGQRETYYMPNKFLWPIRGLDPHGQHARVSIPAGVLWKAADEGKIEPRPDDNQQKRLWDNES